MKNLLITAAVVIMSVLQVNAATSSLKKSISLDLLTNEKKVTLDFSKMENQVKLFSITDNKNEIIFSEKVNKYKNGVTYDLSTLPVGSYVIKIEGENFVEIHATEITKEQVIFERIEAHTAPTIVNGEGKVIVEAASTVSEKISVVIYNAAGDLVHKFSGKSENFHKSFNLQQLESGKYEIIVETNYFTRARTVII